MSQSILLNNFGLLRVKLPEELFKELTVECDTCSDNKELVSGISANGTPKHYFLKNPSNLKTFAVNLTQQYFSSYPGAL